MLQDNVRLQIEVSEVDSLSAMSVCMLAHAQSVVASASQQQEVNQQSSLGTTTLNSMQIARNVTERAATAEVGGFLDSIVLGFLTGDFPSLVIP